MSSDDTNQLCVFQMIKASLFNNEEWKQRSRLSIFFEFHSQLLKSPLFNGTLSGVKCNKGKKVFLHILWFLLLLLWQLKSISHLDLLGRLQTDNSLSTVKPSRSEHSDHLPHPARAKVSEPARKLHTSRSGKVKAKTRRKKGCCYIFWYFASYQAHPQVLLSYFFKIKALFYKLSVIVCKCPYFSLRHLKKPSKISQVSITST